MPESPTSLKSALQGALLLLAAVTACRSEPLDAGPSGEGGALSAGAATNDATAAPSANAGSGGAQADELGDPVHLQVLSSAHISSDESAEHFQRILTAIDLGRQSVARARLHVTLKSPCFPFSGWADEGVPAGQNWPAACDAFDRTLSVVLDPAAPESSAAPGIELLRAITPFGGPLEVESDVTDVVNGLPGTHELRLSIDTWSDADGLVSGSRGEWIADAELLLWPGAAPRKVLAVVPLVLGAQTEAEAEPLSFQVPEGVRSARIDYLVTGHGSVFAPGCAGPAEEFCQRNHELRLDGALWRELRPWRDCSDNCTLTNNDSSYGPAEYCAKNPCADPGSAVAPRANWCPGNMTAPFTLEDAALSVPGEHELTRTIHGLAKGGIWTVSATYFAFE